MDPKEAVFRKVWHTPPGPLKGNIAELFRDICEVATCCGGEDLLLDEVKMVDLRDNYIRDNMVK